jgi:hypothetical protein
LTTTFLLSQSNPVPVGNQSASVVSPVSAQADSKAQAKTLHSYGKLPLNFDANRAQTDSLARFLTHDFAPVQFGQRGIITGFHGGELLGGFPQMAGSIFEIAPLYGSGGQDALSVVVADVNGDGKPDLVVANYCWSLSNCSMGVVSVLLGNGDGTFQAPVAYSSGGYYAHAVVVADVNGDGKPDLLVANECTDSNCARGSVGVLLSNGDGTFQAAVTYSSGGERARSVAVADVNGDGKPDLLVANCAAIASAPPCGDGGSTVASVLLGNGDGTFQAAVAYATGGMTDATSVAVADVNGDGKPDLVVASECATNLGYACAPVGEVGVLLGNGDGTFQAPVAYSSGGYYAHAVVVADVNGDGKPDLLVANECESADNCSAGGISVLLGNGDGTFQAAVAYASGGYSANSVAVGDVNGDGKPDLLVANCAASFDACGDGNNGAASVLLGNGDGTFRAAVTYASGGFGANAIAVGDVNGDGKADVVVADDCADSACTSSVVGVLLGNGDGTFRAAVIYGPVWGITFSEAVGDVNGDGKPDLVVANSCVYPQYEDCTSANVGVLLGNGDGTFQAVVTYGSGGQDARSVVVADVNGDGKPDLVVANECTNDNCNGVVGVLLGNGDGTFQAAVTYGSGGYYADSLAVADVNGDGKPDLVVANECSDDTCMSANVGVLLGNGDGTFQAAVTYGSGGYYADSLAVADVNGDGKLDLLVANQCAIDSNCGSSGGLGVLLGNGDGTFRTAVTYDSGGQYPWSLAVGDVNGDGKPDLVVANQYGTLGVLLGNCDGTFQAALPTTIPGYGFGAIALADFNADGKLDVASGGAILLLGNGDGTFQSFTALGAGGFGIAVGDFNRDGKPDLAVGGVTILLNIASNFRYATTTALTSSMNPSVQGKSVTLTAMVSSLAGMPTGKIKYLNGTKVLTTLTLTSGSAKYTTSKLPPGSNIITAVYLGDSKNNGSTSAPVNQFVLAATTTTLTSSSNPSAYGQAVIFTAKVTSSIGPPPDGETVTFEQGNDGTRNRDVERRNGDLL